MNSMRRRAQSVVLAAGLLAAGLLAAACGPTSDVEPKAPKSTSRAAATPLFTKIAIATGRVGAVEGQREACRNQADGDPTQIQSCDEQAIDAANAIIAQSPGNGGFKTLLSDLFEPLLFARTNGEDALAERVVVTGAFAELALRRAAILAGEGDLRTSNLGSPSSGKIFGSLRTAGRNERSWKARWDAIRAADCGIYLVARCADQLDRAMSGMINDLVPVTAGPNGSATAQ